MNGMHMSPLNSNLTTMLKSRQTQSYETSFSYDYFSSPYFQSFSWGYYSLLKLYLSFMVLVFKCGATKLYLSVFAVVSLHLTP